MTNQADGIWFWPKDMDLNDFPDPVGFESAWRNWRGDLVDGPGATVEVFAREFIQNSWDAIQNRTDILGAKCIDPSGDRGITFNFVELRGESAQSFRSKFGIGSLEGRYATLSAGEKEQKRLSECFLSEDPDSLRILIAKEHGATGMYGVWDTNSNAKIQSSLLRHALLETTSEKKNDQAGGSWGHGKQGVALGSRVRVVGAYTCFDQPPDDDAPQGTMNDRHNLFLAAAYWPRHILGETIYKGLGLIGALQGGVEEFKKFNPLKDAIADSFIDELAVPHLDRRNPDDPGGIGTTFLIVDPSFDAHQLASAIERNWWPLLQLDDIKLRIFDHNDLEVDLAPERRKNLIPFIRSFSIANEFVTPDDACERRDLIRATGFGGNGNVGTLGLTSNISDGGWSWERTEKSPNADLVALVRNNMVIAYQPFPKIQIRSRPYVRGTFVVQRVANGWADKMLRLTEPHLHNEWSASHGDKNGRLASTMINKISESIKKLRKAIQPELPVQDSAIPAFAERFRIRRGNIEGTVDPSPGPEPQATLWDIEYFDSKKEWSLSDPTKLRIFSSARIKLLDHAHHKARMVSITPSWRVMEETPIGVREDSLQDQASVLFLNPDEHSESFPIRQGVIRGELTKNQIEISWGSQFFDAEWIVSPSLFIRDLEEDE